MVALAAATFGRLAVAWAGIVPQDGRATWSTLDALMRARRGLRRFHASVAAPAIPTQLGTIMMPVVLAILDARWVATPAGGHLRRHDDELLLAQLLLNIRNAANHNTVELLARRSSRHVV